MGKLGQPMGAPSKRDLIKKNKALMGEVGTFLLVLSRLTKDAGGSLKTPLSFEDIDIKNFSFELENDDVIMTYKEN